MTYFNTENGCQDSGAGVRWYRVPVMGLDEFDAPLRDVPRRHYARWSGNVLAVSFLF